ncbi:addiction module antidote protein [Bifidobacterium sp. ESL0745]|uniref:addiction module antidote protein n=1 Tax=Bifidobacterium sp. ESL0745 TaxID=2983226 RepID=UPI0023F89DAC|nr:addiction module antidote protein [Bifidobacterium sp. ESL0745]MDF7666222.1 putative addiction module antidote protein [Bifidobacterium sp. ESL0745]
MKKPATTNETFSEFNVSDYLNTKEDAENYLREVIAEADGIEDEDEATSLIVTALGEVAKAQKKMTSIADRANVGRSSLYKSLKKGANPSFRTVYSALRELFGGASPLLPRQIA